LTVALVTSLVEELNRANVVCCHWKSNYALARDFSVDTDLDLLVDRGSLPKALGILFDLGFKPAVVKEGSRTPGVSHHYGFDAETGELIHVHLFSRVLTGESFVKSHLLPFESMLLENTEYIGQIRVASKSAELVLFVVRTFIKYGSLPDLLVLSRHGTAVRAELDWLLDGSDMAESLSLLHTYCPVIDEALFLKCIDVLNEPTSLRKRIGVARQVRRRLRVYARYTGLKRVRAYAGWLWGRWKRRLGAKQKDKILYSGGAVVAIVGPDATGKSTLVAECAQWLSKAFAVQTVHAGKPPSTWLTLPINLVLRVTRDSSLRLQSRPPAVGAPAGNPHPPQPKGRGVMSLVVAVRAVALAWDRRKLLEKARRSVADGEILICDRYPSDFVGAMDSPRLQERPNEGGLVAHAYNSLARRERQLYQQIAPPDIALRLNVSVETAQKRNRERIKDRKGGDAHVEARHRQNPQWQKSGTNRIYDIDTEQSLNETVLSAKKALWASL
jgi:thymidylate kinase